MSLDISYYMIRTQLYRYGPLLTQKALGTFRLMWDMTNISTLKNTEGVHDW